MKNSIIFIVSGLILLAGFLFGAYDEPVTTTRGRAMGNAIFADFDSVNSMSYNPACIAYARSLETYFAWDTPYLGLNDESMINTINFNLVIPFWNSFTIPPDPFVTKDAALGIGVKRLSVYGVDIDGVSKEFYHEGLYSLVYAKNLNNLFKGARLAAGARFNLYDIGVGNVIDVENNENFGGKLNTYSFGLDLGVTYYFSDSIVLGFAYKNLISPNISILPEGNETLPSEMSLGGNINLGDVFGFFKKSTLGFGTVIYGRDANDNRQSDMSWRLGYEFKQLTASQLFKDSNYKGELLSVRLGFNYEAKKVGDEFDIYITKLKGIMNFSAGLGFNYVISYSHLISIDYTFEYGINMGAFRHIASLTYKYLLPDSAFVYKEELKKEKEFEELIERRTETQTNK
ncbi:MAG: conjugal transfer protein TraF [Brevinematia bacterium]